MGYITNIDFKGLRHNPDEVFAHRRSSIWTIRDEALRSCGLLLRQAMERAEAQHQINGMDAHHDTIFE